MKYVGLRAFPTYFFVNFSLRSYFFYFVLSLYKTPPSDSLYFTLFYYNIIFSIIFYYIKTSKCQNQFHHFHLPPPPPFSSNPKPMLGASSNNRLLSLSRNVVVPAPNKPDRKIEIYSLLLHHRYASSSTVSSDHGRFAWFLA